MDIKKRQLEDRPDFITDKLMSQYHKDLKGLTENGNESVLVAQYLDMVFRAGWQSAKNHFKA